LILKRNAEKKVIRGVGKFIKRLKAVGGRLMEKWGD